MEGFSLVDRIVDDLQRRAEEARAIHPADAWTSEERTKEQRDARVEQACKDYWFFVRTYFPSELFYGGFLEPGRMHHAIIDNLDVAGAHVWLGPRAEGKTVTGKLGMAWKCLRGDIRIGATLSHTLPTSQNILADVAAIIADNPRITEDFGVQVTERNAEQCSFRTRTFRHTVHLAAFSEGKSLRGYARMFGRPSFVLGDDIETLTSPLGEDHTEARIRLVSEARRSLIADGTLYWFANNFDERCATNRLKREAEHGILPKGWYVHVYPIWTDEHGVNWPAKYPGVTTYDALRALVPALDEADFMGNDMQTPMPPEGVIFKRAHYQTWGELPDDAIGIGITDPNLSLKGMGDTTAIAAVVFSPTTLAFYVMPGVICRSISDPNDTLDLSVALCDGRRIVLLAFDGSVTQEAHWTAHTIAWCRQKKRPIPPIEYYRYSVTVITKETQLVYNDGRLYFPPDMETTVDGKRAKAQWFAFKGKKEGRKDDFPDIVICAIHFLTVMGIASLYTDAPSDTSAVTGGSDDVNDIMDFIEF